MSWIGNILARFVRRGKAEENVLDLDEETIRQREVLLAQEYYRGHQHVPLTDRQRQFLGFQRSDDASRFCVNFCRTVVNALAERLTLLGITSSDPETSAWLKEWWQQNNLGFLSGIVHRRAIRDGEYFLIIDPSEDPPKLIPHPRYISTQNGGTGYGCRMIYPDGDYARWPLYAEKLWMEEVPTPRGVKKRARRTVYHPDRIERYVRTSRGWTLMEDPIPWVDSRGQPLGIPVVHFRNGDVRSEIADAIPIQDAINKTILDILASADWSGFRILIARGWIPTTDGLPPKDDGSNLLAIHPGMWLSIPRPPTEADVDALEGSDLRPLLELLDSLVIRLAQVTDTPLSRFQISRQMASEGTLKQQEGPLLAKCRDRQMAFGQAWVEAATLSLKVSNRVSDIPDIQPLWAPAEPRDELAELEGLALKHEKLGIPREQIWLEAGYSQEEIARMLQMLEIRLQVAQIQAVEQALQDASMGG